MGEATRSARNKAEADVYCVEGLWDDDKYPLSIVPLLELLSRTTSLRFEHRVVTRKSELETQLNSWLDHDRPWALMLACHGWNGQLKLSTANGGTVSLDQIGLVMAKRRDRAQGRLIHFGACRTLRGLSSKKAHKFVRDSGVQAISGYREQIDWLPSACLDALYLDKLAFDEDRKIEDTWNYLKERAGGLLTESGFTIWEKDRVWPTS